MAFVEVGSESMLLWQLVSCPGAPWGTWDSSVLTDCRSKFKLADFFLTFACQVRQTSDSKAQGEWQSLHLLYGPSAVWIHSETRGCATLILQVSNLSPSGGVLSVSPVILEHIWSSWRTRAVSVCCAVIVTSSLLFLYKPYWARPQYGQHLTTATTWNEFCL